MNRLIVIRAVGAVACVLFLYAIWTFPPALNDRTVPAIQSERHRSGDAQLDELARIASSRRDNSGASMSVSIVGAPEDRANEKRLSLQKMAAEQLQPQVFSDFGKFLDRARSGEPAVSAAAFMAVANRARGLTTLPSYSADDWSLLRRESFDWLEAAAGHGDFYAMWLYGGQAETLLSDRNGLSVEQRASVERKARGYLFSLVSNGVLEAFSRTAGYYLDGTLGKKDAVMALVVLGRYAELVGNDADTAGLQARALQSATSTEIAEAKRLLAVMKADPLASEIGARI